ncbi:hypothetical protein CVT26_011719 [Gymnopilus dilepis]|uniref:Uncharacterized protein n=1 Tax=Gymnopilus dilepis TaxID=231916 RepID=A0A409YGV7_9AGAR|nr:hypothetical protein CVT26_011719 [Gymnopilus dilepis]
MARAILKIFFSPYRPIPHHEPRYGAAASSGSPGALQFDNSRPSLKQECELSSRCVWGSRRIQGTHGVGGPTGAYKAYTLPAYLTLTPRWRCLCPPRRAMARRGWIFSLSFRQPHPHLLRVEERVGGGYLASTTQTKAVVITVQPSSLEKTSRTRGGDHTLPPPRALSQAPGTTSLASKSEWEVAPLPLQRPSSPLLPLPSLLPPPSQLVTKLREWVAWGSRAAAPPPPSPHAVDLAAVPPSRYMRV